MKRKNSKLYSAVVLLLLATTLLSLASCSPSYKENNGEVALTVGEVDISYDFYTYFYLMYQKQGAEEYGIAYTREELMKKTEESLREIAAAISIADEYGISVSKEQEKEIHNYIASIKDGYEKDEDFYNELKNNFMSEQVMFDLQYFTVLEGNLREHMTSEQAGIIDFSDKALDQALKDQFMAAVNILIFPDTKKDGLTGKELADSIYQKILNGGDIYKLAEEYSDDNYYKDRYFAPNTTHEYFENKVASLEIGQLSEVYKSELGYNITKRVAIDPQYVDKYYEELRDEFAYSKYLEIMDQKTQALKLEYSDGFQIELVTAE